MALGSPDYRGPHLAHAPGVEPLDLLEWAPILLSPDELCRAHERLSFNLALSLETYDGRRRFVAQVATAALEDGLEPPEVRYQMALAGFVGVALTCPGLWRCAGSCEGF